MSLMLIVPTWAQTQAPALNAGGPAVDSPTRQHLLGDWGGARTGLSIVDILGHIHGGAPQVVPRHLRPDADTTHQARVHSAEASEIEGTEANQAF